MGKFMAHLIAEVLTKSIHKGDMLCVDAEEKAIAEILFVFLVKEFHAEGTAETLLAV
jgi:hypothetical protein